MVVHRSIGFLVLIICVHQGSLKVIDNKDVDAEEDHLTQDASLNVQHDQEPIHTPMSSNMNDLFKHRCKGRLGHTSTVMVATCPSVGSQKQCVVDGVDVTDLLTCCVSCCDTQYNIEGCDKCDTIKESDISCIASDCRSLYQNGVKEDGVYPMLKSNNWYTMFCALSDDWILVQARVDGSVDFNRNWKDYQQGFGSTFGNYWIGLDTLHYLTSQGDMEIYYYLESFEGESVYARYNQFAVGTRESNYVLTIGSYSGNAGDAMNIDADPKRVQSGMQFTTSDRDNDRHNTNCADHSGGPWWHNACGHASLNGYYFPDGEKDDNNHISWGPFTNKGLKYTVMKIKYRT